MQKKIGFDKFPVPVITNEVPLYDVVTSEPLVDQANLPLVTEAEVSVSEIANANRATSAVMDPDTIEPIKVIEQFPESSETSTTLLGVERAEKQLSLFSDVSTLGFNEDYWETFSVGSGTSYGPWEDRATRDFGNHYGGQMIEETDEQAIKLGAFPVPYSYPFGPRFEDQGFYNQGLYNQYKNFITLGNVLYTYFSESGNQILYGADFKDNFLDGSKVTIDGDEVTLNVPEAEAFLLIDIWTRTWVDIQANLFRDPTNPSGRITITTINSITGSNPSWDTTRPGYSSNIQRFVYMQSKTAYRYQPGRISGYTFGARASADSGSNQNIIEWGIANPTDQYVFQIRGAQFSIVRRSTIPLTPEVIRAQGLDPNEDQQYIPSGNPYDSTNFYTIVIPRDNFNGDTLLGNGPSGYILNPANVTMYKIEFGWYGAIGAKFYVYVPIENGEARWILMHTLVIENQLGQPCLEDPYFRFTYSLNMRENSTVRTPQFIYKYGASMYIDGGDEGTVTSSSYTSGEKLLTSTEVNSIIGLYPKTDIINKEGVAKKNKKTAYPTSITATSSELARIDIVRCSACPGFAYNYNHGLSTGTNGRSQNIRFTTSALDTISIVDTDEYFTQADVGAKLIADGLWSGYIRSVENETSPESGLFTDAKIERIVSSSYEKTSGGYPQIVYSRTTGTTLQVPSGPSSTYPYPVRFSNYDAVAGSITPLTGSKIEIQFLNPTPTESSGHFSDFLLGVTDKKPVEAFDSGGDPYLGWEYGVGDTRTTLDNNDVLFGEWLQSTTGRTREGFENGESNYPREFKMQLDSRIPNPPGTDSGLCSTVTIEVLDKATLTATMVFKDPSTGQVDGNYYLVLSPNVQFPTQFVNGGEVGLFNGTIYEASGVRFSSNQLSYVDDLDVIYYARLSAQLPGVSPDTNVQIALTPVRAYGTHVNTSKIMKFNPYPLYLVCKLRDNSKVNSISVKEYLGQTTVASTPRWLLNDKISKYPSINSKAVDDLSPTNFVSNNSRESLLIDTQLGQQLRPYEVLDSFYVGANETKVIDLSSVFGADRINITPDLLNTQAMFIVGETIGGSGTIQIGLNVKEQ